MVVLRLQLHLLPAKLCPPILRFSTPVRRSAVGRQWLWRKILLKLWILELLLQLRRRIVLLLLPLRRKSRLLLRL